MFDIKNAKRAGHNKSIKFWRSFAFDRRHRYNSHSPDIRNRQRFVVVKYEIPFRITVLEPLAGVAMLVQKGRDELLPPIVFADEKLVFDLEITVDLTDDAPNFLGKFAQGPKNERFVYVNSGSYAGQAFTKWNRRAKLSLMSISSGTIESVIAAPSSRLETTINGIGRDGGPVCASVKGVEWKVVKG